MAPRSRPAAAGRTARRSLSSAASPVPSRRPPSAATTYSRSRPGIDGGRTGHHRRGHARARAGATARGDHPSHRRKPPATPSSQVEPARPRRSAAAAADRHDADPGRHRRRDGDRTDPASSCSPPASPAAPLLVDTGRRRAAGVVPRPPAARADPVREGRHQQDLPDERGRHEIPQVRRQRHRRAGRLVQRRRQARLHAKVNGSADLHHPGRRHQADPADLVAPGGKDDPAWSPDGATIVYWADRDGQRQIFAADRRRPAGARRADHRPRERAAVDPAWSPDGTRCSSPTVTGKDSDIWLVGSDGEHAQQSTKHGPRDGPDLVAGRHLVGLHPRRPGAAEDRRRERGRLRARRRYHRERPRRSSLLVLSQDPLAAAGHRAGGRRSSRAENGCSASVCHRARASRAAGEPSAGGQAQPHVRGRRPPRRAAGPSRPVARPSRPAGPSAAGAAAAARRTRARWPGSARPRPPAPSRGRGTRPARPARTGP